MFETDEPRNHEPERAALGRVQRRVEIIDRLRARKGSGVLVYLQGVDLVEHDDGGLVGHAHVLECLVHGGLLLAPQRVRYVHLAHTGTQVRRREWDSCQRH
jgi:hypothetical protein